MRMNHGGWPGGVRGMRQWWFDARSAVGDCEADKVARGRRAAVSCGGGATVLRLVDYPQCSIFLL